MQKSQYLREIGQVIKTGILPEAHGQVAGSSVWSAWSLASWAQKHQVAQPFYRAATQSMHHSFHCIPGHRAMGKPHTQCPSHTDETLMTMGDSKYRDESKLIFPSIGSGLLQRTPEGHLSGGHATGAPWIHCLAKEQNQPLRESWKAVVIGPRQPCDGTP